MSVSDRSTVGVGPQIGYTTLDSERSVDSLPVDGTLPPWLAGSLLRNGPALFEDRERPVRHWFDGQAMLHRFTIADGNVSYANRFVRSKQYQAMREGRLSFDEFATDPCRSIFRQLMTLFAPRITDNTSVSLTRLGERHYAMTEAPISVEFDPRTLETLGYSRRVPGIYATAHPHHDPATDALINVATQMGPVSSYRFFLQTPGERPRVLARQPVRRPGYIHSFAMSPRYLALTEFPFTVNPIEIPLSGRPFIENFRWQPDRATRVFVFDRATGAKLGTYETEPGFAFHHVGAWEDGDRLVMEYCDHGSPGVIEALYLDKLRAPLPSRDPDRPRARLRRTTIDLAGRKVTTEYRSEHDLELPRINDQSHYLRPYRYVYGIASGPDNDYDTADRLVKIDNGTGEPLVWREPNTFVGEPVFVPAPDARHEDDGVILAVVLEAHRSSSYLVVLDARSMTEIARAQAPHVIPHGLHGDFYADHER